MALLTVSLVLSWGSRAGAQGGEAAPSVRVVQGRATVQAQSTSLAAILHEIGRQSGLPFVLLGRNDQLISLSFQDRPLDDALRTLMRGHGGGALVYEEGPGGERRLVGAYVALEPGGPGIRDTPAPAAVRPAERSSPNAAGVAPVTDAAAVASAEEQLRSGAPEDFISAAIALHPDKKGVDAIYATAIDHPDAGVRQNALGVIAEVGSGEAAQRVLEQAANDPDPGVQALARRMLSGSAAPDDSARPAARPPAGRTRR